MVRFLPFFAFMRGFKFGCGDDSNTLIRRNYRSLQRVSRLVKEMEERAHSTGFFFDGEHQCPPAGDCTRELDNDRTGLNPISEGPKESHEG